MAELKRKPRLMDEWSLRLFADPINGSDKQPFMYFDFKYTDTIDGVQKVADPMIGVNLRGPDSRTNAIKFVTDPAGILGAMTALADIAEGKYDYYKVANTTVFRGQTRLETPVEDVALVIARDAEGVFMGVTQYGREKVKFYFKQTAKYAMMQRKDGSAWSDLDASCHYARVQAGIYYDDYATAMRAGYLTKAELDSLKAKEKAERGAAFNQRQGGQGGGQQGGWGQQQRPAQQPAAPQPSAAAPMDFDADIPF